MNAQKLACDDLHRMGESATAPIERPGSTLAALLLLAGISPLRRRALPAHPLAAHSGQSNYRFEVA